MKVLYFAPGGGLGHLNRALAICLALRARGVGAEIVTDSPFAEGIASMARVPITEIAKPSWPESAREYLAHSKPQVAVFDSFPLGLHGEWADPVETPCVYIARRLRLEAYEQRVPQSRQTWPAFARVIAVEPLDSAHTARIPAAVRLSGPVKLDPGQVPTPVPTELRAMLDTGRAWLVVHAGPVDEVERLIQLARRTMPPTAPLAVIAPWSEGATEYYPAANIVAMADHVISGAGYNIVAEMMHRRDRHLMLPFDRRFDDQAARIALGSWGAGNGATHAASLIADLL